MTAISLETAKEHLDMWLEAECRVAVNQSYTVQGKTYTRADLADIRKQVEFWENKVEHIQNVNKGRGRSRVYRVVPRDL